MTAITEDENLAEVEQLCQSQDDKPGTHKSASSRTYHWRVTEIGTANAEEAPPPSVQENANISKTKSQVLYRRVSVATVKK